MRRIVPLLVAAALSTGCTSALAELIEALGKDPATLCAQIVYGPAVVNVHRTNLTSGKVTCKNGEMQIDIQPSGGGE